MSIYAISVVFIVLFLLEILYFRIANRFDIIDKPNHRSSHNRSTIRGGGIIFCFSAFIFFFCSGFQYPYFIGGIFLIALISFIDDLMTLNNKIRLFVHLLSVALMFLEPNLEFLPWYWLIVAIVFSIGTINAYNFMDGINGLTGLYSLLAIATLYYIVSYVAIDFIAKDFLLTTGLGLIVFNFFNFRNKAVCFAGDVGSVSIAFILLFFLMQLVVRTRDCAYLLLFLVYGLDTVSTIIFRYIRKENIFEAHRSHFYQYWINERKKSHLAVATYYVLVQLAINIMIIFILPHSIFILCLTLFFSILLFIIIRFAVEGSHRLLGQ